MKFISWNVNGLRAAVRKGFIDYFDEMDADIFALQEIKLQAGQIDLPIDGYHMYWHYAQRKGYAGTAIFSKEKAINVTYGLNDGVDDTEGRVITLEFADYFFVTCYTPNARRDLSRLDYRLHWDERFIQYMIHLDEQKPVILCGDLNVAHEMIDIRNAKANIGNSGFTNEERANMTRLLDAGFIDTFRYFHPDRADKFTWWSYMKTVRERNIGWRIDYFIVSKRLQNKLKHADMDTHILGSDHCPIILELEEAQ